MIAAGVSALLIALTAVPIQQDDGVPQYVEEAAEKYGEEYNIAPEFLEAIAYTESRYQADAENGSCKGLMQISVKWHADRMEELGVTDIYDPDGNMHVAADYLSELFHKYEDPGLVLMHYNGASREAVTEYIETGNMSEYTEKTLALSEDLERRHGK